MTSSVMDYCKSNVEMTSFEYTVFAKPFKQRETWTKPRADDPRKALVALDRCLNSLYQTDSGHSERPRLPSNLIIWAYITYEALDIDDLDKLDSDTCKEMDQLIAHLFCHWDILLRTLIDCKLSSGQSIAQICGRLDLRFDKFIRDCNSSLGKCGRHAVYNLLVCDVNIRFMFFGTI